MRFDTEFVKEVIPEATVIGIVPAQLQNFVVDSRLVNRSDAFIALEGTHTDGHTFLEQAVRNGAMFVLCSLHKKRCLTALDPALLKNVCIVLVPDTRQALFTFAREWRKRFSIPIVGITGSAGKTTTKAIVATMMQEAGKRYLVARGNQNTQIGVSLNLLSLTSKHDGGIFEVGIQCPGEMERIVAILRPTIGVITNVGNSHLAGLGTIQDVCAQKRALFSCFSQTQIGIINGDQPLLCQVSYPHPVIRFGLKSANQVRAKRIEQHTDGSLSFTLKVYQETYAVSCKVVPPAWVPNFLAAVAVGHLLEVAYQTIVRSFAAVSPVTGRFSYHLIKGGYQGAVVDDSYNANPESMKAALSCFEGLKTNAPKIAVLGDMLELGCNEVMLHRAIGRFLAKVPSIQKVILVGSLVQWIQKTAPMHLEIVRVETWKEALKYVEASLEQAPFILVKGSRGVGLENLVNHVLQS